jgi:DNA polymerase-1
MSDVDLPDVITKVEDLQHVVNCFLPRANEVPPEYQQIIGIDTETSPRDVAVKGTNDEGSPIYDDEINKRRGLDPYQNKLRTVQISDGCLTFVIVLDDMDPKALHVLQPLLDASLVLGLNLIFDSKQLLHHCGLTLPHVWDIGLAELALTAGLYRSLTDWYRGGSLSSVAAAYLGIELSKEVRDVFGTGQELTWEQLLYSAKDAEILVPIYRKQRDRVEREGLLQTVEIECAAISGIVEMELQGMYLDSKKWLALAHRAEQRRRELYDEMQLIFLPKFYREYFGEETARALGLKIMDPNSIPDTKRAFATIGVDLADCQEKTITAEIDRLQEKLEDESGEEDHIRFQISCLQMDLDYKEVLKQSTSFGEVYLAKNLNPVTGKVHTNFNLVVTGRYSSSSPNLQQLPARGDDAIKYREAFCVPGDSELVIIAVDWSNAETRIMAWFSQEPLLLEALNGVPAKDPHILTACQIFTYKYDDFKKKYDDGDKEAKLTRSMVKNTAFCKAYGGGPAKVSFTAGCTLKEAKDFMDKWEKSMPKLSRWLDSQGQLAVKNMQIRGIAGWRRFFTRPDANLDRWEYRKQMGSIERAGKNTPVQNPNAVWMKQALHELPPLIHPLGFKLCHMVHDEIDLIGHEWYAQEAAEIARRKMIEIGERWLCATDTKQAVKVDAEYNIAKWWSK